ncbi:type IVB secretion system protein IcmH/DotU [Roseomonas sp. NAR14]|uniref:Type IVB secretion system protein IcmH/DotU n=1 Tax=Roseomonas acroporae TaxID=2937791 RepID=A0A9X1Y747_9PROT|nr:type IVB secretion system protein IcmH/DotU [Roseomonas acroporae]MCK8784373.1 type IVB secretion system protein IcmH/DotU [Roseomonas acroporae]
MAPPERRLPLFDGRAGTPGDDATLPVEARPAPPPPPGDNAPLPAAPAGYGPLVRAAWPLLALLARLREGAASGNAEALKEACVRALGRFLEEAGAARLRPETSQATHYALCVALDEAVLSTPWGDRSEWAQSSLLARLHGETWGGETFFTLVDRALADPAGQADLAELLHLLLSFGFQGRYHLRRDGTAEVEALRDRLFAVVRRRVPAPPALPAPQPRRARRRRMIGFVPIWAVLSVCLLAALLLFAWLERGLYREADRIVPQFDSLVPAPAADGPR